MVVDYVKQGKKNRAAGKKFEVEVKEDLESKGWVLCRWSNQVEFDTNGNGKLVGAKPKWNPFKKSIMYSGVGFPDYLAFKKTLKKTQIILVEAKKNGYVDPTERLKCDWLVKNNIVDEVMIAKKGKKKIDYRIVERKKEIDWDVKIK